MGLDLNFFSPLGVGDDKVVTILIEKFAKVIPGNSSFLPPNHRNQEPTAACHIVREADLMIRVSGFTLRILMRNSDT